MSKLLTNRSNSIKVQDLLCLHHSLKFELCVISFGGDNRVLYTRIVISKRMPHAIVNQKIKLQKCMADTKELHSGILILFKVYNQLTKTKGKRRNKESKKDPTFQSAAKNDNAVRCLNLVYININAAITFLIIMHQSLLSFCLQPLLFSRVTKPQKITHHLRWDYIICRILEVNLNLLSPLSLSLKLPNVPIETFKFVNIEFLTIAGTLEQQ